MRDDWLFSSRSEVFPEKKLIVMKFLLHISYTGKLMESIMCNIEKPSFMTQRDLIHMQSNVNILILLFAIEYHSCHGEKVEKLCIRVGCFKSEDLMSF